MKQLPGDMEEIEVSKEIGANEGTRIITLKHPDRDIRKAAFTYQTRSNAAGEKADVEIYGLKTIQPAGAGTYRDEKDEMKKEADETGEKVKD